MEDLKIYQKWEDMHLYLYGALKSYPKSERFTLATTTINASIEVGMSITRANTSRDKKKWLDHADIELARLKILVRIGMKLGFLPINKYGILSGMLTEIGRMFGGWIRSST